MKRGWFILASIGLSLSGCLAASMNYEPWSPQAPQWPQMDWGQSCPSQPVVSKGICIVRGGCSCLCKCCLSPALCPLSWSQADRGAKMGYRFLHVNRCDRCLSLTSQCKNILWEWFHSFDGNKEKNEGKNNHVIQKRFQLLLATRKPIMKVYSRSMLKCRASVKLSFSL